MVTIARPHGFDADTKYELLVARKRYRCDDYPASSADVIKPGDRYVLITEYPGGESGYATGAGHPVRMKSCLNCIGYPIRDAIRAMDTQQAISDHVDNRPGHEWRHGGHITQADECTRCGGIYLHTHAEGCRDTNPTESEALE